MWILKNHSDIMELSSFAFNALFLWRSDICPIYVMDNHLCAAWCWLQECNPDDKYNFMHIDRHADLRGCGYPQIIDFIRKNPHISFEKYRSLSYDNGRIYPFFQWDNYIRACHYLFPDWFKNNVFYTLDDNECSANSWGYDSFPTISRDALCVRHEMQQLIQKCNDYPGFSFIHDNERKNKWILNIDLDFIWDFNGIKVFDDEFIIDLSRIINNSLDKIQVLTIAFSPDCIGGYRIKQKWMNVAKVFNLMKKEIHGLEQCDPFVKVIS